MDNIDDGCRIYDVGFMDVREHRIEMFFCAEGYDYPVQAEIEIYPGMLAECVNYIVGRIEAGEAFLYKITATVEIGSGEKVLNFGVHPSVNDHKKLKWRGGF